jgi:hypothetical protein
VALEEFGALVQQPSLPGDEPLPLFDVAFAECGDLLEKYLLGLEADGWLDGDGDRCAVRLQRKPCLAC